MGQSVSPMLEFCDQVVAFEPVVATAIELRARVRGWPVVPFTLALSDHTGTVDLVAAPDKVETGQLADAQSWEHPVGPRMSMPCASIDDLLRRGLAPFGFAKIDVEGHELAVLQGAQRTLEVHHPQLLIEIHSEALGASVWFLLESFGYILAPVRHPFYPMGSHDWANHYYLRAA
jgi:FkbM family methyltransferase